jgi:hypothetical protein
MKSLLKSFIGGVLLVVLFFATAAACQALEQLQ